MKKYLYIVLVLVALVGIAGFGVRSFGAITNEVPTIKPLQGGALRSYTFFSATTSSATSTNVTASYGSYGYDQGFFVVAGAKRASLFLERAEDAAGNAGTSTFSVQISPDGSNWYGFNKLISNVTNTNAQTKTRVASVDLVGTSTEMVSIDLEDDAIYAIRCVVVETTDGAHTCKATAEF